MAHPAQQQPPQERSAGVFAGRYFGVPVYFSPSWLLFAAYIVYLWSPVVRDYAPTMSRGASYGVAFGFALLLGISVLLHELGHTVVSLALGLKVRRIVLMLLGGVSEIENEPERSGHEYLIAVAGPLVSLILAGIGAISYPQLEPDSVQRLLVWQLMVSNLGVMAFNMLPGLPLDGGRLLRAGVWRLTGSQVTGTKAAAWGGRVVAVVLVVGSLLLWYTNRDGGTVSLLIVVLVALFVWASAGQALRLASLQETVPRLNIADLTRPTLHISTDLSVAETIRRAQEAQVGAVVLVDGDQRPRAVVSESSVLTVPNNQRPWTSIADVARPLEPGLMLRDNLHGEAILEAMRAVPASEYVVVGRDGSVLGVLVTADVIRALNPGSDPGTGSGHGPTGPNAPTGQWGAGSERQPAPRET
ncbi:MAG TPA: site-2 protease family protein [Mycobacteriales bacterium]|nr:site-2 protease family protein [Mycobacteriales bacterium]